MRWFPRKHRVIPEGTRVRVMQDREGVHPLYWIAFDEPAFDVEGDTASSKAQVAAQYLVVLG